MWKPKQMLIESLVGAILVFNSGCSEPCMYLAGVAFPPLGAAMILLSEEEQPKELPRPIPPIVPQNQVSYKRDIAEYLESNLRDLEKEKYEKLKKYEGRKEKLSDLEQALEGLRNEVIHPVLEARIKYDNAKK